MKITPRVIMVSWLATALVTGTLATMVITSCSNPAWHNDPTPLQSGVQPADPQRYGGSGPDSSVTVLDGLPGCFTTGHAVAVECLEHAPRCPHEDGDPSGWPCLWVDQDGQPWYIDSTQYRN